MRKTILTLLVMTCASTGAKAQTFLDNLRKDKQGEGKVIVTQSKDIDKLVDGSNTAKPATATQKPANGTQKGTLVSTANDKTKAATKSNAAKDAAGKDKNHPATKEKDKENGRETAAERKAENTRADRQTEETGEMNIPTVDMTKKVMRRSHKVSGYRVQAYAGGNTRNDKQQAQHIGNAIKMKYPDQPVYVHFYSPRWICRIGNFRTYGEAQKMLNSIKAMGYKSATIVKGMITVQY